MTHDLIEFLRARLDEDERVARSQRVPRKWHQGPGDDREWTTAEMVCMWPPEFHTPYERDKHWRGLTVDWPELAEHIARHDPARVLREVEAKRQIVDECAYWYDKVNDSATEEHPQPNLGERLEVALPVLGLLGLPYAGHPDYREDWRP